MTGAYFGLNGVTEFNENGERLLTFGIHLVRDPIRMTLDNEGNLLVTDSFEGNVKIFAPPGSLVGTIGDGHLAAAVSVAVGPDGRVYVGDRIQGDVRVFSGAGDYLFSFGGDLLLDAGDIEVSSDGRVVVTDGAGGHVHIFDAVGQLTATIDFATSTLALDEMDVLYLPALEIIEKYDLSGNFIGNIPMREPHIVSSIHVDDEGNITLLDFFSGAIQVYDQEGSLLREFGGEIYRYSKDVLVTP